MFHSGCLVSVSLLHSHQHAKGPLHHGPGWPMAAPFPLFTAHDLSEKKHTFQPGVPVRGMVLGVHKTERGGRERRERGERERGEREERERGERERGEREEKEEEEEEEEEERENRQLVNFLTSTQQPISS